MRKFYKSLFLNGALMEKVTVLNSTHVRSVKGSQEVVMDSRKR